MKKTNLFW